MKIFRRLSCLVIFVSCLAISVIAQAASSQHTRDAFYFAEKKNWKEAEAHARASGNSLLHDLIVWQKSLDGDSGARFQDIARLMQQHPDWPHQKRLQIRAEQVIDGSYVDSTELLAWFQHYPPVTGAGMIAQARAQIALRRTNARTKTLIREGWIKGDFTADYEKRIVESLGKYLTQQDYVHRTDRLLWEGKTTPAERMLPRLTPSEVAAVKTRIALINDDKKAAGMLSKLPSASQKTPGMLFARLLWRARRDDDKGVREMLLKAPRQLPFAEKWWPYRERQVREAVDARNYPLAVKLLSHHGLTSGAEYAEAVWLKGWLNLRFLNNPQDAYLDFHHMYENVGYAVSRARAAYWAGRAAEAMRQSDIATSWYENAANYPTTFYGQLSHVKLNKKTLSLPNSANFSETDYRTFARSEVGRIIRLAMEYQQQSTALAFIKELLDASPTPSKAAVVAAFAQEYGGVGLGAKAAKRASQHNIFLAETGYPTPAIGDGFPIELPLVYAIIRQESEFDRLARSSAGAVGMMQLLPSTAKHVAKRHDIPYAEQRLQEPTYNSRLGSLYLNSLIKGYDGSYVKAIAAYNAGPGRVRQWLASFGHPTGTTDEIVDWIEKIPYSETRNYVQRVLENLQIFRIISGGETDLRLNLEADLKRGR